MKVYITKKQLSLIWEAFDILISDYPSSHPDRPEIDKLMDRLGIVLDEFQDLNRPLLEKDYKREYKRRV